MKKKFFAALAATVVMLHGMPVWANESKDYTLDELMQMSLEELETLTDCKGITEKIEKIAANPPLYCENGCISYYILLNEYDKVIPTLWETVTVEDADGRMVDIEQISRDRTAEVLGVPEKALGSIYILSTELNHRGSEVLIETGLEKADVLEVSVNLNAYGEDNICKSYYFVTRQLESDDNENILNIERIRLGKSSERPISVEDNDAKELFGLSVDASAFTLNVGETRELKVSLNTDYYLANSLHFYSDDNSVAWVYPYIGGHVIGTSAGTATIQVSARLDKNKVKLSPEDNGERSVMVKVTVTEPALSESQKAALKKLEEAEQNGWGIYLRERAIITGVLAADAPRLTLDEANRIVDPSQPCEKVWKALMDAQIYPDYYDTGDPTSLVYWLDDRGQEVIGIQDFSMIHYSRADENGVLQEVQYLYPDPSQGTAVAEDSLNISEEIKDHFRVYEMYSDAETKPERRLVQDFKSIMRIYNTAPRSAFTAYHIIDDILASDLTMAKYYVVEDADGDLKFYNENYTEMISTRYAEVGGSRKQLPYVDLPAKALERFRNPDFAKTYISPDAEVENVYWLSGESSMMGTAIYYRTSAGDYVYYNYYAIGEALFPVEKFCAYQQAITDEIAKYPESGGGINIADVWDLSAYQLKELSSAKPGDSNCDGSIDVSDAVLIARFAAEDREATMTDQGRQNADVTHDGNVDGQDTTKILQYIAKKISFEDLVR